MFSRFASLIALAALLPLVIFSQDASLAGEWHGLLLTPVGDIAVTLTLQQSAAGTWTGIMGIPAQQVGGVQLNGITAESEAISFSLGAPGSPSFHGLVVNEGKGISGLLRQGSGTVPLKFARDVEDLARVAVMDGTVSIGDAGGPPSDRPFIATTRHPAIEYSTGPTTDAVADLNRKIQNGSVTLRFEAAGGYLRSLLDALNVPVESQAVVFSKTSVQANYISPQNPRALFFNDHVVVGFIRHAPMIEIAVHDPRQGVIFYVLHQLDGSSPRLTRSESCLGCHVSRNSMDVPGMLVRSVISGPEGNPFPQFGNYISDHRSPLEERWSGWHISRTARQPKHLGNMMLMDPAREGSLAEASAERFNLDGYPSPGSDAAAVMVFDHQMHMMNLLTRIGWEARIALYEQQRSKEGAADLARILEDNAKELVDYLLFVDEASLAGRFDRTSSFARTFSAQGPRDAEGRSLRDLDLERRLMRYPCSYLIYSAAFDALSGEAKDVIYQRMWDVLSGNDKSDKYKHLSGSDRESIIEILRDTKKDLPDYFLGPRE